MSNTKSIFVVDDNPSMLRGIGRLLREYGFASRLFETGGALLRHGRVDSALCLVRDINLGDGSGIELGHRLKEQHGDVTVDCSTGNVKVTHRMAAIRSGWESYRTNTFTANTHM